MFKHTSVVATKDQVSTNLQGESVILNLKSGVYFGLNPVGARIWELVQQTITIQQIQQTIISEYAVETERAESDVVSLLKQLSEVGLIEVVDAETD